MTIGSLITRDNEAEAPAGFKTVFVFGSMTVPVDSPLGANKIVEIRDDYALNLENISELPSNMALWEAPAVAEEFLKVPGTRDIGAIATVERALKLVSQGEAGHPEMEGLVDVIKGQLETLPSRDVMRTIMRAIIGVYEQSSKPNLVVKQKKKVESETKQKKKHKTKHKE